MTTDPIDGPAAHRAYAQAHPGSLDAKEYGCTCDFVDVGDMESGPRVVSSIHAACPMHGEKDPTGLNRICAICGTVAVSSKNPDLDFCRMCWATGASEERTLDERGTLTRIRELPGVDHAEVWQTGGGCMVLAITLVSGVLITASYEDDAGIPPAEGPWGVIVSETEEAWSEWDESKLELDVAMPSTDDEGLVETIRARAALAVEASA